MARFINISFLLHGIVGGLLLALLLIIGPKLISAVSFTATETVANNATVVTEVKAARTLRVGQAGPPPVNGETIAIGTCTVTFATTTAGSPAEDANCTDGATILTTTGTALDIARNASQVAAALRTLTNVSDTGHGTLTVGGSAIDVSFTTTNTETSATAITFSDGTGGDVISTASTAGIVPVAAVAQVVVFTPESVDDGFTFNITINGTTYSYDFYSGTVSQIVSRLAALVDADSAVSCTATNNTVITCTSDTPGTAFTYSSSVTPSPSSYVPTRADYKRSVITQPSELLQPVNTPAPETVRAQVETIKSQLIPMIRQLIDLLRLELEALPQ